MVKAYDSYDFSTSCENREKVIEDFIETIDDRNKRDDIDAVDRVDLFFAVDDDGYCGYLVGVTTKEAEKLISRWRKKKDCKVEYKGNYALTEKII